MQDAPHGGSHPVDRVGRIGPARLGAAGCFIRQEGHPAGQSGRLPSRTDRAREQQIGVEIATVDAQRVWIEATREHQVIEAKEAGEFLAAFLDGKRPV